MTRTALLLGLAIVISVPAEANSPTSPAQPAAKVDNPDNKMICKFVNTTGSRLSRDRECRTRAQWAHQSDEQTDELEQQQSARPSGSPN